LKIVQGKTPENQVLLTLDGELDLATSPELRTLLIQLQEEGVLQIAIDLSEVTYLDSTGMGVIVARRKRLLAQGGDLWIQGAHTRVRRVMELLGLGDWIR
jgi:anti-sigma B factor antagonist